MACGDGETAHISAREPDIDVIDLGAGCGDAAVLGGHEGCRVKGWRNSKARRDEHRNGETSRKG